MVKVSSPSSKTFILSFLLILGAATISSCRPSAPGRSKLWSERTADDFERLLKNGRHLAVPTQESIAVKNVAAEERTVGDLVGINFRLIPDSAIIGFIQFPIHGTPPLQENAIDAFANSLLSKAANDLGITPQELKPAAPLPSGSPNDILRVWTRSIGDIPVRDSRLTMVFTLKNNSYHLTEISNRTYGHLKPEEPLPTETLDLTKLSDVTKNNQLALEGKPTTEYFVEENQNSSKLVPVKVYQLKDKEGEVYVLSFKGNKEPKLLEVFSRRVTATLEGQVYDRVWHGSKSYQALPNLTIKQTNGQSVTVDQQGQFSGPPLRGSARISSTWFSGSSSAGTPSSFGVEVNGDRSVIYAPSGEIPSLLNVYAALAKVKRLATQFYQPGEVKYLENPITVRTDIQDECNAYYQDRTLNFYSKSSRCANMAFVNDVIYHEWGHGLDDFTGTRTYEAGGMTDGAFSEGIGDIVSMFINGDENMGIGFFIDKPNEPLRKLKNDNVHQPGLSMEVHKQGTIIAGAFWELRRRMLNKYGSDGHNRAAKLFFRHLLETDTYVDSYNVVQRLADDDGNPATRHADWCLVNKSFSVKGLARQDSCTDDYDQSSSQTPQNSESFLALGGQTSNGNFTVYSSSLSSNAHTVRFCESKSSCNQEVIKPTLRKNNAVTFFEPATLPIQAPGELYFEVRDKNGTSISKKVLNITKK